MRKIVNFVKFREKITEYWLTCPCCNTQELSLRNDGNVFCLRCNIQIIPEKIKNKIVTFVKKDKDEKR